MMVDLDLEETGFLCQLMMQALTKKREGASPPSFLDGVDHDVKLRLTALYIKLSDANDRLMSKQGEAQ